MARAGSDRLRRRAARAACAPTPAIQGLEGALKTDRTQSLPPTFTPNAFQDELQILVNLPETIQTDLDALAPARTRIFSTTRS